MNRLLPFLLVCLHALCGLAWNKGYPESCSCKETGVTASDCTLFSCDCNCNLLAGQCDYGCCCDPDCTSEQVDRFRKNEACVDYASTKPSPYLCYSKDELSKLNNRAPMRGKTTSEDAVEELMCVVKENHNFQGEFFVNANLEPPQVFSTDKGSKKYSYEEAADSTTSSLMIDSYYDKGDFIPAFTSITGSPKSVAGGFLAVPQADFSGSCNDNYFAQFQERTIAGSCSRAWSADLSSFAQQCQHGVFAVNSYAGNELSVLARPAADSSVLSNLVNITISKVIYRDPTTMISTDVTENWIDNSCGSNVSNTKASCIFGPLASTEICNNALVSLSYYVLHENDDFGTIKSCSAEVIVSDIAYSTSGSSTMQAFGIQYFNSISAYDAAKTNVPANRTLSGNPGYLFGLPVLFGSINSTATAIDQVPAGLHIQSPPANGACPDVNTNVQSTQQVGFGYDISSGCLLSLDRDALRRMCCEGSSSCAGASNFTDSTGLAYFLSPKLGKIGIYGNSDPSDAKQWLDLEASRPTTSRSWNDAAGTCNGLITGINYQFLVAYTGERKNPQNKIISAAIEYTLQDITIRANPNDASAMQLIPLSVTASFIFKDDQDLRGYNPPRPPVLFTLPYDVFYPFGIDSSSAIGLRSHFGLFTMLITLSVTALLAMFPFGH